MAFILGVDRNQKAIVTSSLDEFIDAENSVRVLDAYVESLDLGSLGFKTYAGNNRGQSPYLRTDLLKLHIYGYFNGIRSSRKLETESKRNLELMWLINSIKPDHGTIAAFVSENKAAFKKVLRELTLVLKGWGLVDGKLIAIDGTKIRAQNSKNRCVTKSTLDKKIEYADQQINAYISEIEKSQNKSDRNLKELKVKLEDYHTLKEKYKKLQAELAEKGLEQQSLTDKDSRRMKNNGRLDICYNVQSTVDSKNHFVIDAETVNDINDENQLSNMALKTKSLLKKRKMMVVVDTGYYNASEIKQCVDKKLTIFIKRSKANNKTKNNEYRKDKFLYDTDQDIYQCPEGKKLCFFENTSRNGMKYKRYKCADCDNCPRRSACTTSVTGRSVQRWEHEEILDKVAENTHLNNEIYKQRRCIVEHPFGTIKRTLGYTYFLRKGLDSVNAESASMFIAYNLKRLFSMFPVPDLILKFKSLA